MPGRKRVFWMSNLIAFTAAYAVVIIPVIVFISSQLSSKPKESDDSEQSSLHPLSAVRVVLVMLALAVVVACYVNFVRGKDETGESSPTVSVSTTSELKGTEAIPKTVRALPEENYAIVESSSTYDGDRATHIAYNLIDSNTKTNWTEGVSGNGEGEYVDFLFQAEQPIAGFTIWAGNHYNDSYYTKNARPKTITLTFSDGSNENYTLRDKKEEQTFRFSQPVETESVRLTITSVYAGTKWEDTVISEIDFLVEDP